MLFNSSSELYKLLLSIGIGVCVVGSGIILGPASWGFFNSMTAGKNKSPMDTTDAMAKVANKPSIISIDTD